MSSGPLKASSAATGSRLRTSSAPPPLAQSTTSQHPSAASESDKGDADEQLLFEGKLAWFSRSVPRPVWTKWEKNGGEISTMSPANLHKFAYFFSNDPYAADTHSLVQDVMAERIIIFRPDWIEASLAAKSLVFLHSYILAFPIPSAYLTCSYQRSDPDRPVFDFAAFKERRELQAGPDDGRLEQEQAENAEQEENAGQAEKATLGKLGQQQPRQSQDAFTAAATNNAAAKASAQPSESLHKQLANGKAGGAAAGAGNKASEARSPSSSTRSHAQARQPPKKVANSEPADKPSKSSTEGHPEDNRAKKRASTPGKIAAKRSHESEDDNEEEEEEEENEERPKPVVKRLARSYILADEPMDLPHIDQVFADAGDRQLVLKNVGVLKDGAISLLPKYAIYQVQ